MTIAPLDVRGDREPVGPLVVRRLAHDPLGPPRRLVEAAGNEQQLAETKGGVDHRLARSLDGAGQLVVDRGRANGSPRQCAAGPLEGGDRRRSCRPRRSASSARPRRRRNCHRSTSTYAAGPGRRCRCRCATPATASRRCPGSSMARSRDRVTRTLRPAAHGSRSGQIRSPMRSRRNGPARTSSSSSVPYPLAAQLGGFSVDARSAGIGDLDRQRAEHADPYRRLGRRRRRHRAAASRRHGTRAGSSVVAASSSSPRTALGEFGEPVGQREPRPTAGGNGTGGELGRPHQRQARQHVAAVGGAGDRGQGARRAASRASATSR